MLVLESRDISKHTHICIYMLEILILLAFFMLLEMNELYKLSVFVVFLLL